MFAELCPRDVSLLSWMVVISITVVVEMAKGINRDKRTKKEISDLRKAILDATPPPTKCGVLSDKQLEDFVEKVRKV